jgi:hypothetical protein
MRTLYPVAIVPSVAKNRGSPGASTIYRETSHGKPEPAKRGSLKASPPGHESQPSYTVIGVLLAIFVPICAAVALIVGWYFRLQRHRADAVAMASYRKLAEEAVASQAELRDQLAKLTEHVSAVEQLMREVG